MKIENLQRKDNIVSFEIEEEYSELSKYIDKKYIELSKTARIPGFRPGKIPKPHFINHYGMERLSFEALMDMLNKIYPQIIEDNKLEVIDQPKDINIVTMEENKPVRVRIEVEVKPVVVIKNYKGIRLEKESVRVEKEDMQKEINRFLESHATYVEDDKAKIEMQTIVTLDIVGEAEGDINDAWKDHVITVGKSAISEEFDKKILGLKQGDHSEFEIEYAVDAKKGVPGKKVTYKVDVKLVKVKRIPQLNEELVKAKTDKNNVDEYRKSVESVISKFKEKTAEDKLKEDTIKWIADSVGDNIPQVMVDKEIDYLVKRMELNLKQYNLSLTSYLQMSQKSLEDIRNDFKPNAVHNIKFLLGIESIAKAEKIDVSDEDISKEIEETIKDEKDETKKADLRKRMESIKDNFYESIIQKKILAFLIDNAKIKKK